ncbi:hypothetical protein ACFL3E_01720 [Patescibacteria group bacterium]
MGWQRKTDKSGQSILEVIVAMAIFGLIAASMMSMALGGFVGLEQGGDQTEAEALAQEGIEAVRGIRDDAWNRIIYSTSSIAIGGNEWVFSGEGTTEQIGQYTRVISFADVCRDGSDNITTCPGIYTDAHSKKIAATVTWDTRNNVSNTVQRVAYITNWESKDWVQTDWSGGSGQAKWSDVTKYDSDDGNVVVFTAGQVTLAEIAAPTGTNNWLFDTAGNYTYDSNKLEVTGGYAQLVASLNGSFDTANDGFDSGLTDWSFSMWDAGGGEVDPTGTWQSTGGNTGGYIKVDIPSNARGDELGGYWEQSFTTTALNPITTCYFDWEISQWIAPDGVDDFQFYVFLDNASGEPTIGQEVWSSGAQSGTTGWSGIQSIDCSSKITTVGTYYYKIAVWLDTKNKDTGPITVGYDNAKVHWDEYSYSIDSPNIYPLSSFATSSVENWSTFSETATKNGGAIYYQLSNDDGSTWQYWNGASWANAGSTDYNLASVVNANISTFSTSTNQIKFNAFLSSDGSQLVKLDTISVGWAETLVGGAYATDGYLNSSAFKDGTANYNVIEWGESLSSCTPNCSIKFQVRVATQAAGNPDIWTDWHGAGGVNSYFTTSTGSMIPADLNNYPWVQYKVILSGDGDDTPVLQSVDINYKERP